MESFFDFLVIAGIIIVGVFKEMKKEKPQATRKPTVSPDPTLVETSTDSFSEEWEKEEEKIQPAYGQPNDTARSTRLQSTLNSTPVPPLESEEEEEDFSIHSIEEARKAIIWGEIMQRKY